LENGIHLQALVLLFIPNLVFLFFCHQKHETNEADLKALAQYFALHMGRKEQSFSQEKFSDCEIAQFCVIKICLIINKNFGET